MVIYLLIIGKKFHFVYSIMLRFFECIHTNKRIFFTKPRLYRLDAIMTGLFLPGPDRSTCQHQQLFPRNRRKQPWPAGSADGKGDFPGH